MSVVESLLVEDDISLVVKSVNVTVELTVDVMSVVDSLLVDDDISLVVKSVDVTVEL